MQHLVDSKNSSKMMGTKARLQEIDIMKIVWPLG